MWRLFAVHRQGGQGREGHLRGQPETAEVIPTAKLNVSIGKSALHYCEKHIGAREVVGNKQGSLANRLREELR